MNDQQAQTMIPGDGPGEEYVSKATIWRLLTCFCLVALGLLSALVWFWPDSKPAPAQKSIAVVKPPSGKPSSTDITSDQTTDNTIAQTTDNTVTDNTPSEKSTTTNTTTDKRDTKPTNNVTTQSRLKKDSEAVFKITSISPTSDDPKGGVLALISGSGLPSTATVKFGEAQATEVSVVSNELIRVKVPAHAVGVVDITVKDNDKTAELTQGFSYIDSLTQRYVLMLVLLAGALGGTLYSLISLSWYIGNRELKWSWVPSYIIRPFTAAALACIFFLTLVTGVWTDQTGKGQLWIVGLAALVGLFSKQGYEKLKAIFEAVLAPAPKGADTPKTVPAGGLGIDKSSGPAAGGNIVQVTGSGFTAATTVQFDNVAATSIRLDSPNVLHVVVPPHAPGQINVTVTNPGNPPETRTLKYTYT
jgi:cytoskeletal protein RodZ